MKKFLACVLALVLCLTTVSAFAYEVLRPGATGKNVSDMQAALKSLGYPVGAVDGVYGAKTTAAVIEFQKATGLVPDGKAGNFTLGALYAITGEPGSGGEEEPGNGVFDNDYSKLVKGATGSRVRVLQRCLKQLGYFTARVDGKFGDETEAALIAFQKKEHLAADGKAGNATLHRLEDLTEELPALPDTPTVDPANPMPTRILRPGYTGSDVKVVQRLLKELGFYNGRIDGKYGTGTIAAVSAFQTKNGLTCDGKVGPETRAVLFSDNAIDVNNKSRAMTAEETEL